MQKNQRVRIDCGLLTTIGFSKKQNVDIKELTEGTKPWINPSKMSLKSVFASGPFTYSRIKTKSGRNDLKHEDQTKK